MIKKSWITVVIFLFGFGMASCGAKTIDLEKINPENGVYYEIFVRSFADSDEDGIGDFNGITEKLSYLKDLGITGLWLMPIHPSPSYHGYDVLDYYDVNPDYGTMEDFENLIEQADLLGMKIMLDMVFNHTSNQHPWFLAALDGDEAYEDYYSFTPSTTNTAKVLGSWGQTIWHTIDNVKYCGYFSHTMPDLNFYSENVKEEVLKISEFWIDKGVKGFRLDAVHHLYGDNESLTMGNIYLDNVVYLKQYSKAIDAYKSDIYIIGEIFEETLHRVVGDYFKGLDSPIDFPVAAKIRFAAQNTINRVYVTNLKAIYDYYRTVDEDFISAPFIVNHDMDRFASQVLGHEDILKMSAEMLLTLPGNPIIYYGEEIGMYGVKAIGPDIWDETRRLPILWGDEYTTDWISSSNISLINMNEQNNGIETILEQLENANSLLATYIAMLQVRNNNIALKYGNTFYAYENNTSSFQGFYREYAYEDQSQKVLVIHNFSNEEVDMIDYNGIIIYVSGLTDLSNVLTIPARSTIIIQLNEEQVDA